MANKKHGAGVAVGLGLAAGAAAIAGAYYFYGKEGAKHRKNLKSWTVKAQGEIMEKMEGMQEVTRKKYDAVVTQVLSQYKTMKNVDAAELQALARELKGHWEAISKTLSKAAKDLPKKVKQAAKK